MLLLLPAALTSTQASTAAAATAVRPWSLPQPWLTCSQVRRHQDLLHLLLLLVLLLLLLTRLRPMLCELLLQLCRQLRLLLLLRQRRPLLLL